MTSSSSTKGNSLKKQRRVKAPTSSVMSWRHYVVFRLKNHRLIKRVKPDDVVRFAGLLALQGPPETLGNFDTFYALTGLLLHEDRINRFRAAMAELPPDLAALTRVASCCRAWTRATGRSLASEKTVRVDQVVKVMVQVPAPEPYVRHLHGKGFVALGTMFHPNTLTRTRSELRGVFFGAEGEDGYWAQTQDQLRIVQDDQ